MSIVKKRFTSLFFGILLLVIALLLDKINLLRIILCLLGLILLTYSAQLERSNKKVFIPLFIIVFTSLVIALDYLCVAVFKHTPIFTYSVVSTKYGTVYNGIGYRVWTCSDNTFKLDPLYKLGYYCEKENITSENINNVLSSLETDFDRYKDSYVKVIGRVVKVNSEQNFILQAYEEYNDIIKFDETVNLSVDFNVGSKEISSLKPNSIVTVVGKISRKENNTIYMIDSKISASSLPSSEITIGADSDVYCEYGKELWFQTSDNIFYKSCINEVELKIGENVYNLQNAIKNNLITVDELKNEALGYIEQSSDKSVIYNYDGFKIMICDSSYSKDIIVGRNEMDFSDGYCENPINR